MRTGLIAFGVIFLVLGAILYFMPIQTVGAKTTTIGENGNSDTRTSYATLSIPYQITLTALVIGILFCILGFAISDSREQLSVRDSTNVQTTKRVETGNGNKRTITEQRREHFTT